MRGCCWGSVSDLMPIFNARSPKHEPAREMTTAAPGRRERLFSVVHVRAEAYGTRATL